MARLSVRGDLVKAEYRHLDPFLAKDLDELLRMGHQGAWLGYFGSPAKASKALGHDLIDDWVNRIETWLDSGLQTLYFFIHQHDELYSPELSAYMINKINKQCGLKVKPPKLLNAGEVKLF